MSDAHGGHVAHHFDTAEQQFESGKLGMWIFLATEILLFGGLFCAYAVYRVEPPRDLRLRAPLPRQDAGGDQHRGADLLELHDGVGGARGADSGERRRSSRLLAVTIAAARSASSASRAVEYEHKWKEGLLWGRRFHATLEQPAAAWKRRAATAGAGERIVAEESVR